MFLRHWEYSALALWMEEILNIQYCTCSFNWFCGNAVCLITFKTTKTRSQCWLCILPIADVSMTDLWKLKLKPLRLCIALFDSCPCLVNKSLRKLTMPSAFQRHNNETRPFGGLKMGVKLPLQLVFKIALQRTTFMRKKQCSRMGPWRFFSDVKSKTATQHISFLLLLE